MIYYVDMAHSNKDNMDNVEEKIKNLEEWNIERAKVKPILEAAVDYHNKARREAYWKNHEQASEFFKKAIENYKNVLKLEPKYYLQDVIERVDCVIGEHMYNIFCLKISGERLKTEQGIKEFIEFAEGLSAEEKGHIDRYDIALSYFTIGEGYFGDGNFDKAHEFYNRVIGLQCDRPFLNRDVYCKIGEIFINKKRFKEALFNFVSALSFDRGNIEAANNLDRCLKELKIFEHRFKFLSATPNEVKKLIMEVL